MSNVSEATRLTSRRPLVFYSPKGGQGCSVVAAAVALRLARDTGRSVDLITPDVETVAALLGAYGEGRSRVEVSGRLAVADPSAVDRDSLVVHDVGVPAPGEELPAGHRVMVVRACYLALRAALARVPSPDAIVLVEETGRSLTRRDVEDTLGVPVVATVPVSANIARAVDAGLLAVRVPTELARALSVLLPEDVAA